jgi:TolB-like protein
MSFFQELKRRNVFRVALGYVVLGWLLLQVTDVVVPILELPDWVDKLVLFLLLIGFPLVLFFAWAFELTPEGVKRESQVDRSQSIAPKTGRKLDFAIIAVLAMALAWFAWDKFSDRGSGSITGGDQVAGTQGSEVIEPDPFSTEKSVAVLPFVAMSSGADDEYFADGLTEEILNSLAQLPELLVTARTSSFHFKGQEIPVTEIADKLGVGHIVEGSVRRSGERLRVTAQLVRAADGFHLWSENYDSTAEDTIQVQEDIAEKIAKAMDVVMDDAKREAMREAGLRDVEAFITMQKAREKYKEAHGEADQIAALREANTLYEQVLERVPDYAPAYIEHSDLYVHLLHDDANRRGGEQLSGPELEVAMNMALSDTAAALKHARNFAEQNDLEIDLSYVSGNWRGISGRLQRFIETDGCHRPTWSPGFALPFGDAKGYAERLREVTACDPMSSGLWFDESRAHLWAGDPEEALRVVRQGMEVAPGGWLNHALVWALAANGRFEEIDHAIDRHMRLKADELTSRAAKFAAMGDRVALDAVVAEYLADPANTGFFDMVLYAWSGQYEQANRRAASVDEHVFGPQALLIIDYWCMCGAPWDLEVTPNFAAKLQEAGLPWPPPSPITWPLKDW